MARDANIPLFLWIATAMLVHLAGGGGAEKVSAVLEERLDVRRFAESVRQHVRLSAQPLEVALLVDETPAQPEHVDPATEAEETEEMSESPLSPEPQTEPPVPAEQPQVKDQPRKPVEKDLDQNDAVPPPKPEAEAKKEPDPEKKSENEPMKFPTLQLKNRIAVQQHVEDDQEDNPDAEFIGDQANRVEQQTQARITATDQNDREPNPGSAHSGPVDDPGNSHVTDIAHSEDAPGDMDRAPNERSEGEDAVASVAPTKGGGNPNATSTNLEPQNGKPSGSDDGHKQASSEQSPQAAQEAAAQSRPIPASPETLEALSGSERVAAAQEARRAQAGQKQRMKRLPPPKGNNGPADFLGLGSNGTTRGGINLNLTHTAAASAVGQDQLARERVADGERRRSKHRGSWKTLGIERWRASIENYNSSVKPGNQTALNTARVPFASYLNKIHNRLHPVFADSFLGSLNSLPRDHELNRADIKTNLEIVLDRDEGKVVKMGVTHSSGSTVFDIAALESVQSAAPFGTPPKSIVSPDGNVYLHWEFHRNPYYACSTYFARPFILKGTPESVPPKLQPPEPRPFGPEERPVPAPNDGRRGHRSQTTRTYAVR